MAQANGVDTTPSTTTSPLPPGLLAQEQARQEAIETLRALRKDAENEVERLIELIDRIDRIDGGPDLEPYLTGYSTDQDDREGDEGDGAEPSLGWTEREACWALYTALADVDVELDDCDEEDSNHSGCGDMDGLHEQDCVTRHFATVE